MANEKTENNRERSVQKSFSLKNRQIEFLSETGLGSEWLQAKIDEEIKARGKPQFLSYRPLEEE